jgi:hypothetical protein
MISSFVDNKIDEIFSLNIEEELDEDILIEDMYLSKDQALFLYNKSEFSKFGIFSPIFHWPSGIVFYKFDINFDTKGMKIAKEAMTYIENISCIRFKVKDSNTLNYVLIKRGKACSSKVGMRGGEQPLMIDSISCTRGSVIHELLHTLGFLHMHTSSNRDTYIDINWDNIKEESKLNFKKITSLVSLFGTDYDYNSITHYSAYAFAKDKKTPTITVKNNHETFNMMMGQRKGIIEKIRNLFEVKFFHSTFF